MNTSVINESQLLVTVSDPTMLTKLKKRYQNVEWC